MGVLETRRWVPGPAAGPAPEGPASLRLRGAPVVTVSSAAALIDRSIQATNTALAQLVEAGILRQVSIGRRNRAFEVGCPRRPDRAGAPSRQPHR